MSAPTITIETPVAVSNSVPTRLDTGGLSGRQFVEISNLDPDFQLWLSISPSAPGSMAPGTGTPLRANSDPQIFPVGPGLFVYAVSGNPSGSPAFVREYQ
jgi:hypothetical protein